MVTKAPVKPVPLRGIQFYVKQADGSKGVVTLHIDSNGFLVRIMNPGLLEPHVTLQPAGAKAIVTPGAPNTVPGITLIRNPDGSVTPRIDEKTKRDMQLFVDTVPCWFDGCEQLRAAYRRELAKAEENPDCSNCERGALNRKYLNKMAQMDTRGSVS